MGGAVVGGAVVGGSVVGGSVVGGSVVGGAVVGGAVVGGAVVGGAVGLAGEPAVGAGEAALRLGKFAMALLAPLLHPAARHPAIRITARTARR